MYTSTAASTDTKHHDTSCPPYLSLLIKSHHNHGSTVSPDQFGLCDEVCLSFLQTDAVDDTFALCTSQTRLDHGKV